MYKVILFSVGFNCLVQVCDAQDSITVNDAKVIRAKSEITIGRYLNGLLNTISYTGAESTDIKELINQSFGDNDKQLFLSNQVAIADDVSDPAYSNSSNSPDLPVNRYLNAFNTFYGKSDANSVYFSDIRSSHVKKGKKNIYINVYFTCYFKNICLVKPSTPYQPTKRVAEIFAKKGPDNKWLLYISRIGFYNPADTLNDIKDDIVVIDAKNQVQSTFPKEVALDSAAKFRELSDQAKAEEKKRNYQAAVNLYTKAIVFAPDKKYICEARINELNTLTRSLADLDEKCKAGNYNDAIRGYTELLKNPKLNSNYSNSDYYLGRAKCYDKMGQVTKSYNRQVEYYHDALIDYATSYDYDSENMETIRCQADLYQRMDRNVGGR
jgi:hypothetical protein